MTWLEPVTLNGVTARLEPLEQRHCGDLIEAVKDGELWRLWYTSIPAPEKMEAEIARRRGLQAAGSMLPFAVIDPASGKAVGMTTYMNVDAVNKRVEIGSTWYRRSVQRTPINTQCKLLLLTHAFETPGLHRRRIPHAFLQSSEPPRHRAPGRQARRHPAQPPARRRRHAARHLRLQHHRQRMADREIAPELAAEPAAGVIVPLQRLRMAER